MPIKMQLRIFKGHYYLQIRGRLPTPPQDIWLQHTLVTLWRLLWSLEFGKKSLNEIEWPGQAFLW